MPMMGREYDSELGDKYFETPSPDEYHRLNPDWTVNRFDYRAGDGIFTLKVHRRNGIQSQ